MKGSDQRKLGLGIVALTAAAGLVLLPAGGAASGTPLKIGMDVGAIDALTAAGLKPDYGMLWAGTWLTKSGWGGFDAALDRMYAAGVTPAIQFYYWGADTRIQCIEHGCWSPSSQIHKSRDAWNALAKDLAWHLQARMKGRAAVVVVETEFNKGDVANYEPFDGYLAGVANLLRSHYAPTQVVLGFGGWGDANWGTFDRAAAASNMVGVQLMRASTRDTTTTYLNGPSVLLSNVQKLAAKFGKPVLVTDVALGSYTEPGWLEHQRAAVQGLMDRRAQLREAGAVGIVYRGLFDAPNANTAEYYGQAERTFGLAWAYNRTWKPAMHAWAAGVRAERGLAPAPTTAATSPTPSTTAAPAPSSTPLVVEAERFAHKTAGGQSGMSGASGGYVWNLWSNGYIGHSVSTGDGQHEVKIRAVGSLLQGVAPLMKVEVDGREVYRASVPSGALRDFAFNTWLGSGSHSVRIHFLNDAMGGGEDRNLLLDKVTVTRL